MKILLFKIGAFGDVLMTTPVIRQLRLAFPDAKIDYLLSSCYTSILESNENIDEIIKTENSIFFKKDVLGLLSLSNRIRKRKYDVVINFDRDWRVSFLSFLFGIKRRIGFDRLGKEGLFYTDKVYYGPVKHEVYYYLELLNKFIKVNYEDTKLDFFLDKNALECAKKLLRSKKISDFVVCANFGGDNAGEKGNIRKMPDELFKQILVKLSKKHKIILVGGKTDVTYCNNFADNKKIFNFAGLSIKESIAIMKFAKRIYTTDCGTMHMAATVNENITCFFGPTNPNRKAPLVKGLKVLWTDKDIYEEDYELFGKIPKNKKFFTKLNINDAILV